MKVTEIIETVLPNREVEETGIRPGEKLHEQMIGPEDDRFTFDFDDHYRIYPAATFGMERYQDHGGKPVEPGFSYTSDQNNEWMTREQLLNWLNQSKES